MKNLLTSIILSTLLFASCAKKETTEPTTTVADYNFIDQPLQGLIEGKAWEFKSGIANYESLQRLFWFDFYSALDTNQCDFDKPQTDYVFFAFDNLNIGLTELGLFTQSATFYDRDSSLNIIAFDGAIEILSVDTINTMTITGRLDIRESSNNFVNGNFSITYCK
jgi:hypothetical protein